MNPRKLLMVACCSALGAGCSSFPIEEPGIEESRRNVVDKKIEASADRIEALMVELKGIKLPDKPISDGELISMSWSGDAIYLVESLAKSRGKKFETLGAPKLPLPVTVEETRSSYDDILLKIASQIGHRAALVVEDDRILIHYRLKDTLK